MDRKLGMWKACIFMIIGLMLSAAGCGIEKTDKNKIKDLEFSIVEDSQLPEELMSAIEEKKADTFKLTFATNDALYIVVGYGTQKTNGYSIAVDALYLTSNAIYIDTNLIGPAKGDVISEVESFPYIVVKMEYMDKSVVFE